MNKEEVKIRLDELKQLKTIDCFNEPYTTDPRPAMLVSIRIQQLESVHFSPFARGAHLEKLSTLADLETPEGKKLYMEADDEPHMKQRIINTIQQKMLSDWFINPTQFEEIAKIIEKTD